MSSSATVKRTRCRFRFQPLDLSGALSGSWLPAFAFRHVRNLASLRSAPSLPVLPLAHPPDFDVARRIAAGPLHTAMPVPCFQAVFRPPVQSRAAQARPYAGNSPSVPFRRNASERRIRPAYVPFRPSNPPLGKRRELSIGPRNMIRIPTYRHSSNHSFPQSFKKLFWGKCAKRFQSVVSFS